MTNAGANFKLLITGLLAIALGLFFLFCGLTGYDMDGAISGGLWKGPLAVLGGVTVIAITVRKMKSE